MKITKVSEVDAIEIARNSNTLGTPETDTERAHYYYKLRINGATAKEIKELREKIKKLEK